MIHPSTELRFISREIGYGVVAREFIPKGTITWALDNFDREFTPDEVAKMEPRYQQIVDTYCFRNNKGNLVLCWDQARFVNHSFNSNCLSTAYDFEIAIRDIQPGEELTDDYGYLNIERPFRAMEEGTRRKVVYPDDLTRYYKVWDKKLLNAMKYLDDVPQPLIDLLPKEIQDKAIAIARGEKEMDSILTCYYPNSTGDKHRTRKQRMTNP